MPIIKSAKKRVRSAKRAAVRNSRTKRSLKSALKTFDSSPTTGKKAAEAQSKAMSELDKAVKKGVIHKNKAARKKRQLAVKTASVKSSSSKKTTTKKAPAKKPAAKK